MKSHHEEIRLHDYDLVVVNTSGGKDSQTMMRYLVNLADDQGYPKDAMLAVHADLGRAEWDGVRELAERQAAVHGLAFKVIKRPQGDILEHVLERGMWPSSTTRFCTSDHKRDQVAKVIRAIANSFVKYENVKVLNCMGFRAEESAARAKRPELVQDKRLSTQRRTVMTWLPILNWTEKEVWEDIRESGVEYHRAYDLGMPRLSCVFCIFAPKAALMIAGKENPALLDEYVAVEDKIGHTFRLNFKIRDIREAIERGDEAGTIEGEWCM